MFQFAGISFQTTATKQRAHRNDTYIFATVLAHDEADCVQFTLQHRGLRSTYFRDGSRRRRRKVVSQHRVCNFVGPIFRFHVLISYRAQTVRKHIEVGLAESHGQVQLAQVLSGR